MSYFENNSFDLIMNYQQENENQELYQENIHYSHYIQDNSSLRISTLEEAIIEYYKLFSERLPKKKSKREIHKYILDKMKIEDELDLNERYIFSIYISLNKDLLNKEIKKDIMEEEFHLTLMKWLQEEKALVADEISENKNIYNFNIFIGLLINIISLFEILPIKSSDLFEFNLYKKLFKLNKFVQLNKNKNKNIYNFNIFIGLLINIISLFEILPIKTSDLFEFNLYKKLFKLNKFVKLNKNININVSLSFLINKIEKILKKWKNKMECYELAQQIQKYNEKKETKFIGRKKKRNEIILKDKEDTEADSCSDRGESPILHKLGGLFNKNKAHKQKKVIFDLENSQILFFDKEEKVSLCNNNKSDDDDSL